MIRGSCLCGLVRYEIDGVPRRLTHCHCSQCRKAHGAAFATYACVDTVSFRIVAGAQAVRRYRSSPGVHRSFCDTCGSNLAFDSEGSAQIWIAVGGFDDSPGIAPSSHIFVESRASWDVLCDGLPQHPAGLPED